MSAFASLTFEQQLVRLTTAAHNALPAYGIESASVVSLSYVNNAVFSVETAASKFVLRLHRQGLRRPEAIESELRWLDAISHETPLCVPNPVRTQAGTWLSETHVENLDIPLKVSLLRWIEGVFYKANDITPAQAEKLGAFLAELHHFSAEFQPPADFYRPRLDWEGLFGADSPYNPGAGIAIFAPDQLAVLDAVGERAKSVMATLGEAPHNFGLIHGDFIAKNYLFQAEGETVCAIDFDDCGFGYYLYDLAPALLQWSTEANYAALKDALWRGYTQVRALPDNHRAYLEAFVASRHVASCRWIAGNQHNPNVRARTPQIIADRVEELRRFLQTGNVERKSDML